MCRDKKRTAREGGPYEYFYLLRLRFLLRRRRFAAMASIVRIITVRATMPPRAMSTHQRMLLALL